VAEFSSALSDLESDHVDDRAKSMTVVKKDRSRGSAKPSKNSVEEAPVEEESPDEPAPTNVQSESELSELLDEEPPPKRKGKSKEAANGKATKTKAIKAKQEGDTDPDQIEIKRLQGWLVKCGIRKLWGKELKPYDTPKAKIKHLKQMLTDVGMTGRYSQEKANQIREARELAADIEAVQEGAERWGTEKEAGGESPDARPGRRLVRGAKNYDFLSSDGEETD